MTGKGDQVGVEAIAHAEQDAYQSETACCKSKRDNGMPPRTIVYVNGIKTDQKTHCETLRAIADQTCAKVYGVYNATEGPYRDSVQTGQDRSAIDAANEGRMPGTGDGRNPAVDTLSRLLKSKVLNGEPVDLWAHSQGGAVSSLALYDVKNSLDTIGMTDGLKGVHVTSMGSAAPMWPMWPDGPAYEHYIHVNDATPFVYGIGDDPATDGDKAGEGASVIRFSGDPAGGPFATENLQRSAIPAPTANHDVFATYLKMQKQQHGGCN